MMEKSQAVGADTELEHENEHVEDDCCDLQKKSTMPASGQSDLNPKSAESEDEGPVDPLLMGRFECVQNKAECDSGQAPVRNGSLEKLVGSSSSSNGIDLAQDKDGSKEWGLDKNLPPIKTRREGQLCDYSPSDLSPPSPKRMRQGSQEREDQWNGLWSAEGKQ